MEEEYGTCCCFLIGGTQPVVVLKLERERRSFQREKKACTSFLKRDVKTIEGEDRRWLFKRVRALVEREDFFSSTRTYVVQ